MKKKFKWVIETKMVPDNNLVTNCADIEFFVPFYVPNTTNRPNRAYINGLPLDAGNSMTDTAFGDEENCTPYKITFGDDGQPGGNYLIIKRKIYLTL